MGIFCEGIQILQGQESQTREECGCEAEEITFLSVNHKLLTAADGFHPRVLAYSIWANHIAVIILGSKSSQI